MKEQQKNWKKSSNYAKMEKPCLSEKVMKSASGACRGSLLHPAKTSIIWTVKTLLISSKNFLFFDMFIWDKVQHESNNKSVSGQLSSRTIAT